MKSLQDVLYNWLTIKVVADARPDDEAARETTRHFRSLLKEEHGVETVEIEKDDIMYYVHYEHGGERKKTRFPIELIDIMITQIESEPEKYKNYE
ncbi:hypothetical protein [Bacillus marinisedimentorum]|uniref:hypothetical protein n=1 Tax=Bacillus marinisedimentorum TaxID=1821260 RepID=UPI0007DF2D86|nr:hypothetical protein [Bacillus marinisedimentorum]